MTTTPKCYAGAHAAEWNVVTGRTDEGDALYTATCFKDMAPLLDHGAQSNTVISIYTGGDESVEVFILPDKAEEAQTPEPQVVE